MKTLFLEDLAEMDRVSLVSHIIESYEAKKEDIEKFDFLIAYESVGNWGCDSTSFFLLRDRKTRHLFEVHGSHCSCYGFEDQWKPEPSSLEYLKSEKFSFYVGGYDSAPDSNKNQVYNFIQNMKR